MPRKILRNAEIIEQIGDQWDVLFQVLLWKTNKMELVDVTAQDIEEFHVAKNKHDLALFTRGYKDGIKFQLMDAGHATALADFVENNLKGNA